MNNIAELVERLKVTRHKRDGLIKDRELIYVTIHIDELDEAIEALSPPLPEEVRTIYLQLIDMSGLVGEPAKSRMEEAANLIERLAQNQNNIEFMEDANLELQQRITELEAILAAIEQGDFPMIDPSYLASVKEFARKARAGE